LVSTKARINDNRGAHKPIKNSSGNETSETNEEKCAKQASVGMES